MRKNGSREISFSQYRTTDLFLFAVIVAVAELFAFAATVWFPEEAIFSFSFMLPLALTVMMRWGWPSVLAVLLFFWPYLIYLLLFLFGTTASFVLWKKTFWPFYVARPFKRRPQDIEPEYSVKETDDQNDPAQIRFIEHQRDE